jgi:hypothetical protein
LKREKSEKYGNHPSDSLFTIGIITAGHYFPFGRLYNNKMYIYTSAFVVLAYTLSGFLFKNSMFFYNPLFMVISLVIMIIGLSLEKTAVPNSDSFTKGG